MYMFNAAMHSTCIVSLVPTHQFKENKLNNISTNICLRHETDSLTYFLLIKRDNID